MPAEPGLASEAEITRAERVVSLAEAAARLGADLAAWREAARLFPVRWPEGYLALAESPEGEAIRRMGLPHPEESSPQPGELADPVGEAALSPVPFVVRKHPDRVILLVTATCHFYCRFCFRRSFPDGGHRSPSDAELARALEHLAGEADLREIILSGGDPLTLSDERLVRLVRDCAGLSRVERIRIHSRAPVHAPERVTDELARALVAACGGKPLRLVTHPNHAVELTPSFERAVAALQASGIEVLSQSVLLRGVNDDAAEIARLFRGLRELGVTPHYLHHPDRVPGAARFFVSIERGLRLVAEAEALAGPGLLPPHVIDVPDGSGKVPVSSLERLGGRRYRAPSGFEWDDIEGD